MSKFYTWHDETLVLDPGYFAWYSPVPAWYNHPATLERPFGSEDDEFLPQVVEESGVVSATAAQAEAAAIQVEKAAAEAVTQAQQTAAQATEAARAEIKTNPITWVALGFLGGVLFARWRRS